ncbi:MAG: hypothetical protein IJI39_03120, partial [Clostridia bacterium]|nr:hypothetical protein [Clostridia bacterium]
MQKFKSLVCTLIVSALLIPYTAFAAENTRYGYGEGVIKDPFDSRTGDTFSLAATSEPLNENEKELINYIADKIPELNETIEIPEKYQLPETRFAYIYTNYMGSLLQFEHPEVFYLSGKFSYEYKLDPQHTVTSLKLIYSKDYADFHLEFDDQTQEYREIQDVIKVDEIRKAQEVIADEINNITSGTEGMTDLQKALYVHDYITVNYDYDTRVYSDEEGVDGNRTLDKMIKEKTGVCQGYTYLYMTAMRKLGIECAPVPSDALNHIWNKVKIEGEWYNVDVTYDDPISSNSISISHDYFLVNDEEIKELDPSNITYEYYYQQDADGNIVTDEKGEPVIIEQPKENSCHISWNDKNWDGSPAIISASNKFSYSPLHSIDGTTVYANGKFYCFNVYNDLCEIIFENEQQFLRERYVLSRDYRWFAQGQHRSYYTNLYLKDTPFYSSTLALYNEKVYFNSPNTVYEFDTNTYTAKAIYEYDGTPD